MAAALEEPSAAALIARLHADLEDDASSAMDSWTQAEKALKQALRKVEQRQGGGRVVGCGGRRPIWMASQQKLLAEEQARWGADPPGQPEASAPSAVRSSPSSAPRASPAPRAAAAAMLAGGGGGMAAAAAGDTEEDAAARHAQRQARNEAARENAAEFRRLQMAKRASDARDRLADHGRRRLRAKIVGIVVEVQRQKALDQQVAKEKKVLEDLGKTVATAAGDADAAASVASAGGQPRVEDLASPRRARILEALTLDELQMLKSDPWFFFESPQLVGPDGAGPSRPPGSASTSVDEEGVAAALSALSDTSIEGVIDFFTPTKDDKNISIADYARKLRLQLEADAQEAVWRQLPMKPPERKRPADDTDLWDAQERMPCQGRRPAVRDDLRSPTLAKVREVYTRREEADAKWLEDKRDAMMKRINLNDFKAKEQQREAMMQVEQKKEMHKVRLFEAQERKAATEAAAQETMNNMERHAQIRLIQANNKAEDALEAKRDKATAALDHWYEGVENAERYLRNEERRQIHRAEQKWNTYVERLWRKGHARHNATQSLSQQHGDLKFRIQSSLREQIQDQQRERGEQIMADMESKLAAAAQRRRIAQRGGRYGLLERAFGEASMGFDAKYHTVQTDRRGTLWRRSAEAWATQSASLGGGSGRGSRSLSEPSLARTRA